MSDSLRDVFKNEVIRASAGTGKTFELSNRFLRLLASGADCETILATTFTRKGAGEILDRIVQRLAKAAMSEADAAELSTQLNWQMDQKRVQDLLKELISNLHRLQIGTLDAFFYRIAQTFRLELQLPTQWQIASEQQIAVLQTQIVQEILHDENIATLLHLMTHGEAQRKIADLIQQTVNDLYEIYTQSKKEDWHRLAEPTGFNPNQDFSSMIDELSSMQYNHGSQPNVVLKDAELIRQHQWSDLAGKTVFSKIIDGDFNCYSKPLPEQCVKIYQAVIEYCRQYVAHLLFFKNSSTHDLLEKFGDKFEADKTATGQLRFGDVTARLEQFIVDKQTDDFAFRLDHNVDHLLLDEFQDTSVSQWNVIAPFAERTVTDDDKKSFFCVGDLKQAIFGWRGGVAEIFDTVENNLTNMSQPRSLVNSYRSSQVIIDSVNAVFENLDQYKPKENKVVTDTIDAWSNTFVRQETARGELPGHFTLEFAADSDAKPHTAKRRERNENVYTATVAKVEALQKSMPGKTIGVLVRKNADVGKLIFRLRDEGISASEEGGNLLTDSVAIEKILALLTLADHPGDSIARYTVSHGPLAAALGLQPEDPTNQRDNQTAALAASETIRRQIMTDGYGVTVEHYARLLARICTHRELSRLQQVVQEAYNYEKAIDQTRTKLRPAKFVQYIRTEFKANDASSANVRVMTIHQSKGLEFDIVILPVFYQQHGWFAHKSQVIVGREEPTEPINLVCRLTNQSFRKLLPTDFQEAFDESERREVRDEICLLYVALTRAIHATHAIMSQGLKPDSHSTGSVLLATLCPDLKKEGVVFEIGNKHWFKECEDRQQTDAVSDAIASQYYLPLDATTTTAKLAEANRSRRGMRRVSPSGLEGGDKIRMGSIFETIEKSERLDLGTVIHACFEKLTWIDGGIPERMDLETHIQTLGPISVDADKLFDDFFNSIGKPNVQNLLTESSYLSEFAVDIPTIASAKSNTLRMEVQNERPFSVTVDDKLLNGFIDRLLLVYDGDELIAADIIDYKTDAITSKNLDDRIRHYQPQLLAYRNAVSQLYKLPLAAVAARLAFVKTDEIISLHLLKDDDTPTRQNEPLCTDSATKKTIADQPNGNREEPAPPKFAKTQQLRLWNDQ